jgi:hypothetical protein
MFKLQIGDIEELYDDMETLTSDVCEIFPDAFFSSWNDSNKEIWQDIFESYSDRTIIGKIIEVN